jgi:hypothetical protein
MAARLAIALLLALSGCATLSASGWAGDARKCQHGDERMHPNGYWAEQCREGKGVLLWAVWEW